MSVFISTENLQILLEIVGDAPCIDKKQTGYTDKKQYQTDTDDG
jgi:hypothetical protein